MISTSGIEERLDYIKETKSLIKQAIENYDIKIPDNTTFKEYPAYLDKITEDFIKQEELDTLVKSCENISGFKFIKLDKLAQHKLNDIATNNKFINIYGYKNIGYMNEENPIEILPGIKLSLLYLYFNYSFYYKDENNTTYIDGGACEINDLFTKPANSNHIIIFYTPIFKITNNTNESFTINDNISGMKRLNLKMIIKNEVNNLKFNSFSKNYFEDFYNLYGRTYVGQDDCIVYSKAEFESSSNKPNYRYCNCIQHPGYLIYRKTKDDFDSYYHSGILYDKDLPLGELSMACRFCLPDLLETLHSIQELDIEASLD